MPQLDRLLSAVISNKADALTLDEGNPAKLELQGSSRAVTKSPLTAQQVIGLLKEIAPPDAGRQLDATKAAAFTYRSADGAFAVRAAQEGGKWRARITPGSGVPNADGDVGFNPLAAFHASPSFLTPVEPLSRVAGTPTPSATRPAVGTPNAAMPNVPRPSAPPMAAILTPARPAAAAPLVARATTPASTGAALDHIQDFAGSEEARATLEQLLRTTVERGASDLHLRCGEPPIIRLHGEMHRMEGWSALENAHLDSMLRSIMPERNRIEFGESNDTDYAHEIPGCARCRATDLRDRMGVAAVFRQIPSQVVTVEQMQITQEVQQLCYLTKGLVLVTGPTGSGKSTTLCALIDMVNR